MLQRFSLPLLAVGILLLIWFSESVTATPKQTGPVHIAYWEKWTDFEGDAMRAVVEEFNKSQNRIHVDILTVSAIQDKTLLAVAGGIPPDVAGLYARNVAQYADARALTPLDDYCAKAGLTADHYLPAYWNIGYYHNRVWALPSAPASTALHYNRDMLTAAGANPDQPPKTLEELDALAEKITTKNPDGTIKISGFMPEEPGWWNWGWGYLFGGKLWDGDRKITANDPANVRAWEWVQSYSKRYGAGALQTFQSGFGNFSSPQNAFLSRKVAMEEQGVWMHNFIRKFSPDLKWSAAPFPRPAGVGDGEPFTFVDEDILVIPRGAKHPNEAFEFIKFVESQKGMEMLCLGQRKNSPLAQVSDEFYKKSENPYIRLFADLPRSPNAVAAPKMGIWLEYTDELTSAFQEMTLLKISPKDALDRVQIRMQARFDEYNSRLDARKKAELNTATLPRPAVPIAVSPAAESR